MDFDPSDDQRLLLESVSRLLADNYGFAQRKTYLARTEGYSPDIWAKFAELGLLGLPFAEEYGGFGGGAQEVMLVMQAFGRVLVLEPFLSTVVLGGTAIQVAGSDAQKKALLPAIAEGGLKLAFAHGERQARYDLTDVVTTAKRRWLAAGWFEDRGVAWRGGGSVDRQCAYQWRSV
jgi:alkylation response protein AidB-like acyl-CoA dehydrogenase